MKTGSSLRGTLKYEHGVARQRYRVEFSMGVARFLVAILLGALFLPGGSLVLPQLLNQSHAGAITTSGLILNLDANDVNSISGAATTWKDLSGNGYDATLSSSGGGYSISNDTTNKAISFSNGTIRSQNTGASASIAQAIPSQTWTGFSASFSANMGVGGAPSGGINDWSRVFDFSAAEFTQGSGAKGGMFISRFERSNTLWLGFPNMTTTVIGECAGVDIISNEAFAHYAVTVASDGKCVWYKNGTAWRNYRSTGLTNSNTDFGSTGSGQTLPTSDAKTSLRIGRSHWNDIYLTGSIRNLAIYNTTLTSAQVTTNYNGQTAAYVSDVKPTLASASISGTAQVGTQLTAVRGTTTGSNITTAYQWRRADTSGGTYSDIASATNSTYTPVSGDGSKFIRVVITVSNTGGSASATSAATGQVSSTVTLATPAAPTVSATSNTLKSISVSWSAITNASSYTLKLHNSSGTLITTTGLSGRTGTSATITTSNLASLADSTAYKVSITAIGNGSTYLDSVESTKSDVTTNAPPGPPTITVQPVARSTIQNSTAIFNVTATSPDSGVLSYQWQVFAGSTWENLAVGTGFITNAYTTPALAMTSSGYQYRVNITNTKNGATSTALTSNAAVLTVNAISQSATISLDPGVLIFRQPKELRATVSIAGRVTFKANNRVIPGCIKKAVAAGGTVTCTYLPSNKGSITITATFDPTDNAYVGTTASSNNVVAPRTGRRGG